MAAIYGLPTNSPLQSPDRTHPPMRLTSYTPSSSPPANVLPPSSIAASMEAIERPTKRPRILRSSLSGIDVISPTVVEPYSPLPPAGPHVTPNYAPGPSATSRLTKTGSSAEDAISVEDENDAGDTPTHTTLGRNDTLTSLEALEQSGTLLKSSQGLCG